MGNEQSCPHLSTAKEGQTMQLAAPVFTYPLC